MVEIFRKPFQILTLLTILIAVSSHAKKAKLTSSPTPDTAAPTEGLIALPNIAAVNTEKTCRSVDLKKKLPPTRDQGTTGWCYAMSAADLLSMYLGINVSGPDIAINYQNRDPEGLKTFNSNIANPKRDPDGPHADSEGGGYTGNILDPLRKAGGACPDANLPDHGDFAEAISQVELLVEKKQINSSASSRNQTLDQSLETLAPRANLSGLELDLEKVPAWKAYTEIDHAACDGKRIPIPKNLRIATVDIGDPEDADSREEYLQQFADARRKIDSLLDRKTPVGYGSHFYFDDPESPAYTRNVTTHADDHQTTIVGRKWDKNRKTCLYEIRNNWGNDPCRGNENMELHRKCKGNGKCSTEVVRGLYNCDPATGTLWLSESEMISSIISYNWIELTGPAR